MFMKNISQGLFLLTGTLTIAGCISAPSDPLTPPQPSSAESLNNECLTIRQQMLLNEDVSNVPEQFGANPISKASFYKEYEELNCDAVIQESKKKNTVIES